MTGDGHAEKSLLRLVAGEPGASEAVSDRIDNRRKRLRCGTDGNRHQSGRIAFSGKRGDPDLFGPRHRIRRGHLRYLNFPGSRPEFADCGIPERMKIRRQGIRRNRRDGGACSPFETRPVPLRFAVLVENLHRQADKARLPYGGPHCQRGIRQSLPGFCFPVISAPGPAHLPSLHNPIVRIAIHKSHLEAHLLSRLVKQRIPIRSSGERQALRMNSRTEEKKDSCQNLKERSPTPSRSLKTLSHTPSFWLCKIFLSDSLSPERKSFIFMKIFSSNANLHPAKRKIKNFYENIFNFLFLLT